MDIRQRVIGAVVVVSLAIIFIPMLLEKPHEDSPLTVQPVPPPPVVQRFTVERAEQAAGPAVRDDSRVPDAAPAGGESGPAESVDRPPAQGPEPVAVPERLAQETPPVATGRTLPPARDDDGSATEKDDSGSSFRIVEKNETVTPPAPVPRVQESAAGGTDFRLDGDGRAVGWSVQIGTFRNRGSATAIRDELMANKTGGYVQDFKGADGQVLTRVFAGPFLERKQAETVKGEVDKRYKVSSLVVQYRPSQ